MQWAPGHTDGDVDVLNHVIDLAVAEFNGQGGTRIVPGHGRICNQADVVEYRDMATIVRDRVRGLVKAGRTLDQIKAARVTLDYDGVYATRDYTGNVCRGDLPGSSQYRRAVAEVTAEFAGSEQARAGYVSSRERDPETGNN